MYGSQSRVGCIFDMTLSKFGLVLHAIDAPKVDERPLSIHQITGIFLARIHARVDGVVEFRHPFAGLLM